MTNPVKYQHGILTGYRGQYGQLAATYMIPIRAGSMLIGSSTWTKTTGRNGYWVTPSAPCLLHVWICSAATTYRVIMKTSGGATNMKTYLSHSTGMEVGRWEYREFLVPAITGQSFNFAINQGKGSTSVSALGLVLGELVVWEEY